MMNISWILIAIGNAITFIVGAYLFQANQLTIGALYLILLLTGFLTVTFYVGDLGWGLLGRGEMSRAQRLWSFVAALFVITLLGLVPLLGALLLFALMLLGVGVLKLGMYRAYIGD